MSVIRALANGIAAGVGSRLINGGQTLIFVEFGGRLSTVDPATATYRVLGSGYSQPEDVAVDAQDRFAYVTERTGNLLRVDLQGADQSPAAAKVVASGLSAPHQIALDKAINAACVIEFAAGGNLQIVNLANGAFTRAATGFQSGVGLLLSADGRIAYVSENSGQIVEHNLDTGTRTLLAAGLTARFMLSWPDEARTAFLFPQRQPSSRLFILDVTASPPQVRPVSGPLGANPPSAVLAGQSLLVCTGSDVLLLDASGVGSAFESFEAERNVCRGRVVRLSDGQGARGDVLLILQGKDGAAREQTLARPLNDGVSWARWACSAPACARKRSSPCRVGTPAPLPPPTARAKSSGSRPSPDVSAHHTAGVAATLGVMELRPFTDAAVRSPRRRSRLGAATDWAWLPASTPAKAVGQPPAALELPITYNADRRCV